MTYNKSDLSVLRLNCCFRLCVKKLNISCLLQVFIKSSSCYVFQWGVFCWVQNSKQSFIHRICIIPHSLQTHGHVLPGLNQFLNIYLQVPHHLAFAYASALLLFHNPVENKIEFTLAIGAG